MVKNFDIIVIGAGASGLMATKTAVELGKSVAVIDFAESPARKIQISGGGRCNFTNLKADVSRYFGQNPKFAKSALSQLTANDILHWISQNGIKYTEKAPGQYFCKESASDIVDLLLKSTQKAKFYYNTSVKSVSKNEQHFIIETSVGEFSANSIIVATGNLSFPSVSVSDLGFQIAKQFGHKIVPVRPALCAIVTKAFSSDFAGISLDVEIKYSKQVIRDSMLFTHFGLGGPAVYRLTVRDIPDEVFINFLPKTDVFSWLKESKRTAGKKTLRNILSEKLPYRLADFFVSDSGKKVADYKDSELKVIADKISYFRLSKDDLKPYGMQSAEVARGGVSTDKISSKTMESELCPGLFFAGEVLDITGDLGGFNLQWAWSSGYVAGLNA